MQAQIPARKMKRNGNFLMKSHCRYAASKLLSFLLLLLAASAAGAQSNYHLEYNNTNSYYTASSFTSGTAKTVYTSYLTNDPQGTYGLQNFATLSGSLVFNDSLYVRITLLLGQQLRSIFPNKCAHELEFTDSRCQELIK
jgi:hypothetical protein